MKAIRYHVEELVTRVAEIESKATELVEIQVEKERLMFISNYSAVTSEFHNAADYWSAWEPKVRAEAMSIVRGKLDEYQTLLAERRRELERMHLEQLTIRDRWAEMRLRLNPERYEDSNAWWGSMIRPIRPDMSADILSGIPEFVNISESQLSRINPHHLIETARNLSKIHITASASIGVEPSAHIPWTILRSTSLELLKELSAILEKKQLSTSIVLSSINIIDILLRSLYCQDLTQFDDDERDLSRQITEHLSMSEKVSSLNPSMDPVVARFSADGKAECMQAAMNRLMDANQVKETQKMKARAESLLVLQGKLQGLQSFRQTGFEIPWESVWTSWTKTLGSAQSSTMGDMLPPPLQYTS
jgi:hypothetical protein